MQKWHQPTAKAEDPKPRWKWKRWLSLLLLLIVVWLGYRSFAASRAMAKVVDLQAKMSDPNLTDEQRRALFGEMRTAMAKLTPAQRDYLSTERDRRMEADLDRYLAMNKTDQRRYLDDRINKMQQAMAKMNANSKSNTQTPKSGSTNGVQPVNLKTGSPGGKSMNPDDIEARKKKGLDKSSADMRAKMDRLKSDMEKRMKERGITPPTQGMPGRRRP